MQEVREPSPEPEPQARGSTPAPPSRGATPAVRSRAATPAFDPPVHKNWKDPRQSRREAAARWIAKPENKKKAQASNAKRQTTTYAYAMNTINRYRRMGEDPSAQLIEKYQLKKLPNGTWVTEIPKPDPIPRPSKLRDQSRDSSGAAPQAATSGNDALASALSLIADRLGVGAGRN